MKKLTLIETVVPIVIGALSIGCTLGYFLGRYLHEPIGIKNLNCFRGGPQVLDVETRKMRHHCFLEDTSGKYRSLDDAPEFHKGDSDNYYLRINRDNR